MQCLHGCKTECPPELHSSGSVWASMSMSEPKSSFQTFFANRRVQPKKIVANRLCLWLANETKKLVTIFCQEWQRQGGIWQIFATKQNVVTNIPCTSTLSVLSGQNHCIASTPWPIPSLTCPVLNVNFHPICSFTCEYSNIVFILLWVSLTCMWNLWPSWVLPGLNWVTPYP